MDCAWWAFHPILALQLLQLKLTVFPFLESLGKGCTIYSTCLWKEYEIFYNSEHFCNVIDIIVFHIIYVYIMDNLIAFDSI